MLADAARKFAVELPRALREIKDVDSVVERRGIVAYTRGAE
jgi:hypothetical protein